MRDKDKETRNNKSKPEVINKESDGKDKVDTSMDEQSSSDDSSDSINEKTVLEDAGVPEDSGVPEKSGQKEKKEKTPLERITELEAENSSLKEEILSLKDTLLRKQADFENFRKRLFKEKEESIKYANQMLLLEITALLDDFERAIKSAEEAKNFDTFHDGIVLIEKQFISVLEKKWGIKRIESSGECFDPDKHLSIVAEESAEYENSIVLETYQRGYLFYDRVLRPAKVKVGKPVKKQETPDSTGTQETSEE